MRIEVVIGAIILPLISGADLLDEGRTRSFALTAPNANAHLKPIVWTEVDTLEVEFQLQTHSYDGRILLLQTTATGANPTILRDFFIDLNSRGLNFTIVDGATRNVIVTARPFDIDVSDSKPHKVGFMLDLPAKRVTFKLDAEVSYAELINLASTFSEVNAAFYLGGHTGPKGDEYGIAGCITEFSIVRGNANVFLPDVDATNGDVLSDCPDFCLNSPNFCATPHSCLNRFSTASCDCYQAGKEGNICDSDSSVVNFESGKYLSFATITAEDKQPERLAISFKTVAKVNQLLLFAPIQSSSNAYRGQLIVAVDTNSVSVVISDKLTISLNSESPLNDNNWHKILITLAYNKRLITAMLDGIVTDQKSWKLTDKADTFEAEMLQFESELFYANNPNEATIATAFDGCMKDVYVGYEQILHLAKQSHPKVKTSDDVKFECPAPVSEIPDETESAVVAETTVIPQPTDTDANTAESDTTTPPPKHHPVQPHLLMAKKEEHPVVTVLNKCDQFRCAHQTKCVANLETGDVHCNCTGSHYTGQLCQFSTLPRTCDEIYHSGSQFAPGIYMIDPDGSGDVPPSYVRCSKKDNEDVGVTEIDHNFPDKTVVRNSGTHDDYQYDISYKFINADGIKELDSASVICHQSVNYECNNAPLELSKFTWFHSVAHGAFATFGGFAPGTCPCSNDKQCSEADLNCNCDNTEDREQKDEGLLRGQFAGVTGLVVKQHRNQGYGRMSIGPLMCEGTLLAGMSDSVVFRSKQATLKGPVWKGVRLGFWFRTSSTRGVLVSQGAPSEEPLFKATLHEGHVVHFQFAKDPNEIVQTAEARVVSQHPLNDSNWHHVTVEFSLGQYRFTVDHFEAFLTMPHPLEYIRGNSADHNIIIGGVPGNDDGFIGCIKSLYLDTSSYSVNTLLRNSQVSTFGIAGGCEDHCTPNPCKNEAKCSEDYEFDTYTCICANPYAHSGKECHEDINVGGEISFNSFEPPGFISFTRLMDANPLSSNILLSVKTDRSGALLLFAQDQYYNFIQIHLWDTNKLTLTLNHGDKIKHCTIQKDDGEFGNMQWIQLALKYHAGHTAFYADDQLCEIEGQHELSQSYISEWTEGQEWALVTSPRLAVEPTDSESIAKFTIVYVGGVPLIQNRLKTFFSSQLPHLLGCMRGFKVNDSVISLTDRLSVPLKDAWNGANVGCNTGCESLDCHSESGGHCKVNWRPPAESVCDCSLSSYTGKSCTDDTGVTFSGESAISFDLKSALAETKLTSRQFDSVHFAFSTATVLDDHKALLLRLTYTNDAMIEVYLEQVGNEESLGFRILQSGKEVVEKFSGNFSDNFRHFVYIRLSTNKPQSLSLKVDRRNLEIPVGPELTLDHLITAQIGGPQEQLVGLSDYVGYNGCLSNLVLSLGETVTFQPIEYYLQPNNLAKFTRVHSSSTAQNLKLTECGKFAPVAITGATELVSAPLATFPPWDVALVRTVVDKPVPIPTDEEVTTVKDASTASPFPSKILIIILAIVLTVIVVAIFIYVYYVRCIRKRPEPKSDPEKGGSGPKINPDKSATQEEKKPLNPKTEDPVEQQSLQQRLPPLTTHPEVENEENEEREEREFHTPEGSNVSRSSLQSPTVFAPDSLNSSYEPPRSYPVTPTSMDETVKTRASLSSQKSFDPHMDVPYADDQYQRLSKEYPRPTALTNKPPLFAKPLRLSTPPLSPTNGV